MKGFENLFEKFFSSYVWEYSWAQSPDSQECVVRKTFENALILEFSLKNQEPVILIPNKTSVANMDGRWYSGTTKEKRSFV